MAKRRRGEHMGELDDIQHSAEHKHLICIKSNSIAGPKNNQEIFASRAQGKLWILCMRTSPKPSQLFRTPASNCLTTRCPGMSSCLLADVHLSLSPRLLSTFSFHFHKWLSLCFLYWHPDSGVGFGLGLECGGLSPKLRFGFLYKQKLVVFLFT